MKLIFIRHAQAGAYCADDAGRDLTDFGQYQAKEMAEHLSRHHTVDLIITSPYNRAKQTATILSQALNHQPSPPAFVTLNNITPDDDPKAGIDGIDDVITKHFKDKDICHKTIAIVCHMPIISKMVAILDADGLPAPMFDLAEYRVLMTDVIAPELAVQAERFSPPQPM